MFKPFSSSGHWSLQKTRIKHLCLSRSKKYVYLYVIWNHFWARSISPTVRIWAFQARDPGSTPGWCTELKLYFFAISGLYFLMKSVRRITDIDFFLLRPYLELFRECLRYVWWDSNSKCPTSSEMPRFCKSFKHKAFRIRTQYVSFKSSKSLKYAIVFYLSAKMNFNRT